MQLKNPRPAHYRRGDQLSESAGVDAVGSDELMEALAGPFYAVAGFLQSLLNRVPASRC